MKNYTPARQELKKRGWNRRDRTQMGEHIEYWNPPPGKDLPRGYAKSHLSFAAACRIEGIEKD